MPRDPMVPGQVSHYRIVGQIGSGGMGVVYEAEDTRLGRAVALKFLPASVHNDEAAWERFRREARAASALNHPNICTIHEMDEADGQPFIVMELLVGETLARRISGRPLHIDEVLAISVQLMDALDAAHAEGILHRDIKPANVFITTRGQVKVLDFGLAKRGPGPAQAQLPTVSAPAHPTGPGTTVGTLAYMSPEQARGLQVDSRSDLFSCGAVLYEMCTGRLPFAGETAAVIADGILNREPVPPGRINPEVPAELERTIMHALEKDRELRYQSAAELRAALLRVKRDREGRYEPAVVPRARRITRPFITAALIVVAAVVAAWFVQGRRDAITGNRGDWQQLTDFTDSVSSPALSPDGRMVTFLRGPQTFTTQGEVYVKSLPDGEAVQLTRDGTVKMSPVFSPDGARVAFTVPWDTWIVPITGGEPRMLLPNASGLTWTGAGDVLYAEIRTGIHMGIRTSRVDRAGARDVYFPAEKNSMAHRAALSPDSRHVLVVEMENGAWVPCRLVPSNGSTPGRRVGPPAAGCTDAAWTPDGRWMYLVSNAGGGFHIWRQRVADGDPEQVTAGPTEEEGLAISRDGSFLVTAVGIQRRALWVLESGAERQLTSQGNAILQETAPFSSDGSRVFFLFQSSAARDNTQELSAVDVSSGRTETIVSKLDDAMYAVLPGSNEIVYATGTRGSGNRRALWIASTERRYAPHQIAQNVWRPFVDADGWIWFSPSGDAGGVSRIRKDGSAREEVLHGPGLRIGGVSPNGRWMAVNLPGPDAESQWTIELMQLGTPNQRVPICVACHVRWSADGGWLYIWFQPSGYARPEHTVTVAIPIDRGTGLPPIHGTILRDQTAALALPRARALGPAQAAISADEKRVVFVRETASRNLFRVPIR